MAIGNGFSKYGTTKAPILFLLAPRSCTLFSKRRNVPNGEKEGDKDDQKATCIFLSFRSSAGL